MFPDKEEDPVSKLENRKRVPRKADVAAPNGRGKAMNKKPLPRVKDRQDDSEAIERAVYDGMQDLRVKKPR